MYISQFHELSDLGDYYYHFKVASGNEKNDDVWGNPGSCCAKGHIMNSWFVGKISEFHPGFQFPFSNQHDIISYPVEFVKSTRFTKALKAYHMTIGSMFAGIAGTIHHTYTLVKLAACAAFIAIKSLWDLETRERFLEDLKATCKNELLYHINMLVVSLLQIIPVAGIFLPRLYWSITGAVANKAHQTLLVINDSMRAEMKQAPRHPKFKVITKDEQERKHRASDDGFFHTRVAIPASDITGKRVRFQSETSDTSPVRSEGKGSRQTSSYEIIVSV